jgi:uncharacterized membrane protein
MTEVKAAPLPTSAALRFFASGRILALLVAVALSASPATVSAAVARYDVVVTGVVPNGVGHVAMNDDGHIAYWRDVSGARRGFLWDGTTNIPLTPTSGGSTVPTDINASGVISGFFGNFTFSSTAAYWDPGGAPRHDLSGLGGTHTMASAINDNGLIAGSSRTAGPNVQYHLVTWQAGQIQDLGQLPSSNEDIFSVNNAGQILGATGGPNYNSWVWQGGQYRFLKDLVGGIWSDAFDMNGAGVVTGVSRPNGTNDRAVIWPAGQSDPLALPLPPGSTFSRGYAINDAGDVVGYGSDESHGQKQVVLWRDGQVYPLSELIDSDIAWNLLEGWEINNAGQILVVADAPGQGLRELLLTPQIPEPGCVTLVTAAAGMLRRRR